MTMLSSDSSRRITLVVALAIAASALAPAPALAARLSKEENAQRRQALEVFKQGKTAYKASDYDAALKFFRKAQAIFQHEALIILALAKTLDRAEQIEKAKRYYGLFLKESPPTDRAREKTVLRIKAIDDELSKRPAVLVLQNLPTAAELKVNGKNLAPNAKGELVLPAGKYRVNVSLQHHYPFSRESITLQPGERRELPVVLQRIPDPSTLPRDHTWTWVAGAATGVGVLATGALALQSFFKRNEYFDLVDDTGAPTEKGRSEYDCEPAKPGDPNPLRCDKWLDAVTAIKADHESYQTAAAVSGLIAGGLGIATAVAFFAAPIKNTKPTTSQWQLTPTGSRSIGLTLRF
jgi:tetratricopeptide (TPR) repeat protein